jgi:hypothetical protein
MYAHGFVTLLQAGGGLADAGGQGMRPHYRGMCAPAQDPALGLLDAVEPEAQPDLAPGQLGQFLAAVPPSPADQVCRPGIKVDNDFVVITAFEDVEAVAISEVSAAGSVPELMVVNRGNNPVLLIDGEELAGAKQNRVLNTSILLKEVSETKIPVSCTEQGRWSYASKAFSESGNVMAYKSRSRKTRSVHQSLESCGAPMSDQGEVWHGIAELQAQACAPSPTSAMSDVYKAREDDLRQCDERFKPVANQVGLLAFIGGKAAGADMLSLTTAYVKLHPMLVRSYTLEGLLDDEAKPAPADGITSRAKDFLAEIAKAEERQFASVGHGTDYRYKAKALAGTALVHENEVIHAAFFRLDEQQEPGKMASFSNRRRRFTR